MRRLFVLIAACLFLAAACSDPDTSQENNNLEPDVGADAADGTDDADAADGGDVDTGPTTCEYQVDCPDGTYCEDTICVEAPECPGLQQWEQCVAAFEEIDAALARRAYCDGSHCKVGCIVDQDCHDGQVCTDNGQCVDFGGEITGEHPGGDTREALQAGVANTLMTFPIGLSQGGYGSRASTNAGRYVESLDKTSGQMHGLYARAFVLDNGERQLMFVRLPVIFPSMPLHEAVARKLQAETGRDWRDSLVISGTHTHSGPTRYWQLPGDAALPLGSFGTDEFHQQVFDWTVDSTFEAAQAALDDLSEARFGWEIVEGFDTDDRVSSDRWGQTPPFDDNRLLVFRIDDGEGNPRAVMMSYGTHGTVHGDSYFTGDVLAGAERALEARLGEDHDRFVPVLYFSQNGGTMSPRGDHWGHKDTDRYEALGHTVAERVLAAMDDIQTTDDLALDGVTHRFPITYEGLGYEDGEWQTSLLGEGSPNDQYSFGALQCGSDGDDDYSTHSTPPVNNCAMPIHFANHHRSATLFAKSQMTALTVGELTVVTMPGEASMELGWQVLREARDRYGVDPLSSWIFGYAQDHQFYLTPTNLRGELPPFPGISTPQAPDDYPDFAFSWFQGGYEAKMSVWGWKFGDFLVERAMETVGRLAGEEVDDELPPALPTEFSRADDNPFPVDATDAGRVATIVEDVPETVARLTPIEFAWVGGDPGAEMPQAPRVVLERQDGASFEEVQTKSRRPHDNREPVMLTRVRSSEDSEDWQWVVRWEAPKDVAAGQYRFRVEGHYLDDGDERQAYEALSRTFELAPNEELSVDVAADETTISGVLGYPPGEPLAFRSTAEDKGRVGGNFRMRHPKVPLGTSAPLVAGADIDAADITIRILDGTTEVATLSGADVTVTTADETVDGRDGVPVTRYEADVPELDPGSYDAEIDVVDVYGNHGSAASTLDVP